MAARSTAKGKARKATPAGKGKGRAAPAKGKAARKPQGPNSAARKVAARKAGKCQLCGEKVAQGYSVTVTPPRTGKVAVRKAIEGKSHWCKPCATRKQASYRRSIARAAG